MWEWNPPLPVVDLPAGQWEFTRAGQVLGTVTSKTVLTRLTFDLKQS